MHIQKIEILYIQKRREKCIYNLATINFEVIPGASPVNITTFNTKSLKRAQSAMYFLLVNLT